MLLRTRPTSPRAAGRTRLGRATFASRPNAAWNGSTAPTTRIALVPRAATKASESASKHACLATDECAAHVHASHERPSDDTELYERVLRPRSAVTGGPGGFATRMTRLSARPLTAV